MKKAKEYAKQYLQAEDKHKVLSDIILEFFDESQELIKIRNAKIDGAIVAIIKELNEKWNAFARRTNGEVKEDGFINLVKSKLPFMADYLENIGI